MFYPCDRLRTCLDQPAHINLTKNSGEETEDRRRPTQSLGEHGSNHWLLKCSHPLTSAFSFLGLFVFWFPHASLVLMFSWQCSALVTSRSCMTVSPSSLMLELIDSWTCRKPDELHGLLHINDSCSATVFWLMVNKPLLKLINTFVPSLFICPA